MRSKVLRFRGLNPTAICMDNGTVIERGDRVKIISGSDAGGIGSVVGFGAYCPTVIVDAMYILGDGTRQRKRVRPLEYQIVKED